MDFIRIILPVAILIFLTSHALEDEIGYKSLLIRERSEKENYVIYVKYPEFTSGFSSVMAVNDSLESFVLKKIAEYKSTLGNQPGFRDTVVVNNYDIADSVYYASRNLISVELDIYSFVQMQAHPENVVYTFNYDLSNGLKIIQLQDLFNEGYLKIISDFTYRSLKDEFEKDADGNYDDSWLRKGTAENSENFKNFLITQSGLIIVFNTYQVAPYYFGARDVFIPYSALSSVWNYSGPIGNMLR